MQFNQPLCGYGFPNLQYSPYVPQVIGEGEVVSALYPDGSVQYHFIPCAPQRPQNFGYTNNACWNPYGVWFVRNSVIPLQQPITHQQCKPSSQFLNTDSDITSTVQSSPEFNLKFHNDNCTSTSDLHYFFPALRGSYWLPKVPACVQVELPIYPRKTCSCSYVSHDNSSSIRKNSTVSIADSDPMEIDSKDTKTNRKKKSNSVVICECEDTIPETSNKSVVTYADKSSDYKSEKDNNTQTATNANIRQRRNKRYKPKSSLKCHESCSCIIDECSDYDAYE